MFMCDFETDNAAFTDGLCRYETSRILRNLAKKIEAGANEGSIIDINGNSIGHFQFEDDAEEEEEEE